MQDIIVEKPYRFIPPYRNRIGARAVLWIIDGYMWRSYGIRSYECRGAEHLSRSLDAGHGIVLAGNHSRPCDPMASGWLTREVQHPFYCIASWHVFMESRFQAFMVRSCGAFSINREGADHASLNFAVQSLVAADRPVIIFPEGSVTRSNDLVRPLLDGSALIARMAAKKRAKLATPKEVVIHPVAFKYFFRGDLQSTLEPVLDRIEERLGWQTQSHLPLLDRVRKLAASLLCIRELEYLGDPQTGAGLDIHDRVERLIEHILVPLEREWTQGKAAEGVYPRVQQLRSRILPDMINGNVTKDERQRRWRQLADCYVAQQLGCYPRDYLGDDPSPERLLETVERLEEDLTDTATIHRPLDLVIQIGEAIEVAPRRPRGADGDPLTSEISIALQRMIDQMIAAPPALKLS